MAIGSVILNERGVREARACVAQLEAALSSEKTLADVVAGLPSQVIDGVRRGLSSEKRELLALIDAYEAAQGGDISKLKKKAGNDPGMMLIVARIARGLSQKELARKLGLVEQQIQRYEADRYRAINLANFQKVANFLGIQWTLNLTRDFSAGWAFADKISASDVKRIRSHARKNKWFDDEPEEPEEESFSYLQKYVADHVLKYGTPSLLRTGLNVVDHADDWALLAWKARIVRIAEVAMESMRAEYQPLDVSWLLHLVKLSEHEDGPVRAQKLLRSKGIVLVFEPQIQGMKVDGAAFLVRDTPVIGMTLRRDTIDNFWFTLLHEVAHIILHYRTGLAVGFFDDVDNVVDEMEREANEFASNMLVPEEKWRRSPARIATSPDVIEKFAQGLKIHPAIVFGRIQKERNDYRIFSSRIGRGTVRKQFFQAANSELNQDD